MVAGGSGTRFGGLKQFAMLAGRPVAQWSVETCRSVAAGVILVVPEAADDDGLGSLGADRVVRGGDTRSASVRAGLAVVPSDAAVIVVHDAARPLASVALFRLVVDAVANGAAGAICTIPVSDTIKAVQRTHDGLDVVSRTIDRAGLVNVQTPQAFAAGVLRRAHRTQSNATDDAALVEELGLTVWSVPGDRRNFKLTTPDDLAYAELLLMGRL